MHKLVIHKLCNKIIYGLVGILLFLAAPAIAIWYGDANEYIWLSFAGGVIIAACVAWGAYKGIKTLIRWLLGRPKRNTALQIKVELWKLMNDAYRELAGPVVDPTRAKRALETGAEKGAVWEGAVFAILNRVIARDPTAWVTYDSHSYSAKLD